MALSRKRLLDLIIHNDDLRDSEEFRHPTSALPGTPEKEQVMIRRVAAHLSPFHPDDARMEMADNLAIEQAEDPGNGACSHHCCIERGSGENPLAYRAARTDGKRVEDERTLRARMDARRLARLRRERGYALDSDAP